LCGDLVFRAVLRYLFAMDSKTAVPDGRERRRHYRIDVDWPVELVQAGRPLGRVITGRVLDISKEGMRITFWHDDRVGARFRLKLVYKGFESICDGDVVWKSTPAKGMIFGIHVVSWVTLHPELNFFLTSIENAPAPEEAEF